mmetsp:Transcript_8510/g.12893  ORF Transcript_8510/g.12893 Transcript_8510/m.12893 type:complete len:216 (-) Transcript_8510:22-669(-)
MLLLSIDPSPNTHDKNGFLLEWQNDLMEIFLQDLSDEGIERIRNGALCDWLGVHCYYTHMISGVKYEDLDYGNFCLSALPYAVDFINIHRCHQEYELDTRSLPRELCMLLLHDNLIYGQIDLTNLPPHLMELDLSLNRIIGPIFLQNLPKKLKSINLHGNRIVQSTLFHDDIPESIEWVDLTGNKNKVGAVLPISSDRELPKKRIFFGIRSRNVY